MNLAFLIYTVETLTYNNAFFLTIFWWMFVILLVMMIVKLVVNYINQDKKILDRYEQKPRVLEEGDKFILNEDLGELKAGETYKVSAIYPYSNKAKIIWYRDTQEVPLGSTSPLSELITRLTTQEPIKATREVDPNIVMPKLPIKTVVTVMCLSLCLHTFLPSRQTAILMAGAYAIEQIASNDKTKELGSKMYNVMTNQLDAWAVEVPELASMVGDEIKDRFEEK